MCGIAGILDFGQSPDRLSRIVAMTDAMRHRGPDDEGFALFGRSGSDCQQAGGDDTPAQVLSADLPYVPKLGHGPRPAGDQVLALGHRRLSVVDLSPAGHQPMCTEDRRYWIVHNGEVYNYPDICEQLQSLGETFFSHTDTEVILRAYRRWGPDCLQRFNGMWAFAIWDNVDKQLFCARDRIGIKPFYYVWVGDTFMFASDIKTLMASGLYKAQVNIEGLYHAMSFQCAPRPMTCFKGVCALEPAHWMTIKLDRSVVGRRYWNIETGQVDESLSERQWIEKLGGTLRQSVQRRLITDVPIGTFMSGGVDSTTVSAMAAQQHSGIKAFTLAYEQEYEQFDELDQASATATMHGMNHVVQMIKPQQCLDYVTQMIHCYGEPGPMLSPNYLISRFAADNDVTVVLNGLGGDELFGGYGRDRIIRRWARLRRWRSAIRLLSAVSGGMRSARRVAELRNYGDCYVHLFSPFTEAHKRRLFADDIADKFNSFETFEQLYGDGQRRFTDGIEAMCYFDMINYVPNHHLYRGDLITMQFSLESRFPMLDHELVELAFRMPSGMKVRGQVRKYALRQVARDLIDPSCLSMDKKGFSLPMADWMRGALQPLVVQSLDSLKQRGIMRPEQIDRTYTWFLRDQRFWTSVWPLVSIELWLRHVVEAGPGGVQRRTA